LAYVGVGSSIRPATQQSVENGEFVLAALPIANQAKQVLPTRSAYICAGW